MNAVETNAPREADMQISDTPVTEPSRRIRVRRSLAGPWLLAAAVILVTLVFAVMSPAEGFLGASNLQNIIGQSSPIIIMSIALVFVITAGEIDLSFAALVPVSGYTAALIMPDHGMALAVVAALGVGIGVGLLNGLLTVGLGAPSFIVTLGTLGVLQGVAHWMTGTVTVVVGDQTFITWFAKGPGPITALVLWSVVALLVGHFIYRWTGFGRAVHATGGNEIAAKYSGIRTNSTKVAVLTMSSFAGAFAGLLYAGRLQSVAFNTGSNDLLTVLAAVIIGGTLLAGGKGSVLGAVLGALLLGVVANGLVLLGLSTPAQLVFQGVIIVVAVALSAKDRWAGLLLSVVRLKKQRALDQEL